MSHLEKNMSYYENFVVSTSVVKYNNAPMVAFQAKDSESLVHLTDGKNVIRNISTVGLKVLGRAKLHTFKGQNFLLTKRGVINVNNGLFVKSVSYQNFIVSAYKTANELPSSMQPVIDEPAERNAELINSEIAALADTISQAGIATAILKVELMELATKSCETPEAQESSMIYKGEEYGLNVDGVLIKRRTGNVVRSKPILAAWSSI